MPAVCSHSSFDQEKCDLDKKLNEDDKQMQDLQMKLQCAVQVFIFILFDSRVIPCSLCSFFFIYVDSVLLFGSKVS